jgi:hypothetical protein
VVDVDVVLVDIGLELLSGEVSLASQRFGSASVPRVWGTAASKDSALGHPVVSSAAGTQLRG